MTSFQPETNIFYFYDVVKMWRFDVFLRKISSSQISVLIEIAIQNKVPVVMSSIKLCYTFFPISSHNEYADANITFH